MPKTGGRIKGTPNKVNADLRGMILGALAGVGGQEYLMRQADENPAAFLTLIGKVLPTTLTGEGGGPVMIITGVRRELHADDDASPILITGITRNLNGAASEAD
jgi:hypothetical protein